LHGKEEARKGTKEGAIKMGIDCLDIVTCLKAGTVKSEKMAIVRQRLGNHLSVIKIASVASVNTLP
jgi:hypothetical protein